MTDAGFEDPLIVGSNDLDEDIIADLKRQGAKINAWGVGTHLITASDSPSLSGVYKLVAIRENGQWLPRIKITSNMDKATDPGRKQLLRYYDGDGRPVGDVIYGGRRDVSCLGDYPWTPPHTPPPAGPTCAEHQVPGSFCSACFDKGRRLTEAPPIASVRRWALDQIAALPEEFKRLRNPEIYRVVVLSEKMGQLKEEMLQNPRYALGRQPGRKRLPCRKSACGSWYPRACPPEVRHPRPCQNVDSHAIRNACPRKTSVVQARRL